MSEELPDTESELVLTRDGSHTVYSPRFDQHYHNPNGAIAESRYVFFEQTGLLEDLKNRDTITILEIGFGTGLNLMLLLDYCLSQNSQTQINYYTVEAFPLPPEMIAGLNYEEHLEHPEISAEVADIFRELERGMNRFSLHERISVHLFNGFFEDFPQLDMGTQYVFHDAFSPDVNADLWRGEVFKKIAGLSAEDVILSTYCAASGAKGAMAWAGWKLAKSRGALGKREMTLAALTPERLDNFERIDEERLSKRYERGDFQ